MGVGMFHSFSSYDEKPQVIVKEVHHHEVKLPNPDPNNFKIIKIKEIDKFLILLIEYPDCTNFEGKKILVYENWTVHSIRARKNLDPHFTNSVTEPAPIARFIPTDRGWRMAVRFCRDFMKHGN